MHKSLASFKGTTILKDNREVTVEEQIVVFLKTIDHNEKIEN